MDLFSCLSPFVFCSLSSGSDGNSYFVGCDSHGILVDAGISAARIKKMLKEIGYEMRQVKAVFVSHDHIDHIAGLQTLVNRYGIPLFAHPDCLKGIFENKSTRLVNKNLCHEFDEVNDIAGIRVEPFPVSHDGKGCHGFFLEHAGHTLTIATDLGYISDSNADFLKRSDSIVIESNYDNDMLWQGTYPYPLKKRISGEQGHLSNGDAAAFVVANYRSSMKNIMLGHLSANNNKPELALNGVYRTARYKKVRFSANTSFFVLPRNGRTGLVGL